MERAQKAIGPYDTIIARIRMTTWSGPLGKTMSFTGNLLRLAGDGGAPFVGALGSALLIGSKLLIHGPSSPKDHNTQIKDGLNDEQYNGIQGYIQ